MDDHERRHGHGHGLDATAGRDVVFCHACSHEWYRDEGGLTCPLCTGDITEIISLDNDPRDFDHRSSTSTSPEIPPFRYPDDSDPDEADIDEHVGQHGFVIHRSVRGDPTQRNPHNPGPNAVLDEFLNMIHSMGGGPRADEGRGFPGQQNRFGGQPHVHHTTFTTSRGGSASVTILASSGPRSRPAIGIGARAPGADRVGGTANQGADPFQTMFSNILRDMRPPTDGEEQHGGPPAGFAQGLREILTLMNPGHAAFGDAVYSQEALDQIITNLMEANPQSNAAPPATEQALQNLDRRPVTTDMLNGESSTDCTICIEELKEGDTAAFLPCKHWFHADCVILWLKEHNTCPICRTPVEKSAPPPANNASSNEVSSPGSGVAGVDPPNEGADPLTRSYRSMAGPARAQRRTLWGSEVPQRPGASLNSERDSGAMPIPGARPSVRSRPPSQSQTRLNEAIRGLSSMQEERHRHGATASGFSYDTSRLQRRNSLSPTSPPLTAPEVHGARMRQRSPSESTRRGATDRDTRRQSGGGPLSWLRDRFSGGSGGNGGSTHGTSREDHPH